MDFLRSFGFEIDFGKNSWRCTGKPNFSRFGLDSFDIELDGDCAGLADISVTDRERVMQLVNSLVKTPVKTLQATNLARPVIAVRGHPPIRQPSHRYSPFVLTAAQKAVDDLLTQGII